MQVSKSLHEVTFTSNVRKNKMDDLIKIMSPKGVEAYTSQVAEQNNAKNVEEKNDNKIKANIRGSEDVYEFVSSED